MTHGTVRSSTEGVSGARGQVWTWGEPWGDFSMHVDRAPKRVEGAAGIVKIACGAFHNLALNACAPHFWGACRLLHMRLAVWPVETSAPAHALPCRLSHVLRRHHILRTCCKEWPPLHFFTLRA